MKNVYDVLILGSGPIGASTANFMSRKGKKKIGVISEDQTNSKRATYQYAGGCIRWFWDEPLKIEMTKTTADFIKKLSKSGVDVSLREDTYLFLYRGVHAPAINISGTKLVNYFLKESEKKGVQLHMGEVIKKIKKTDNIYTVITDKTEYQTKKVLLALGSENARFMENYPLEKEERYLLVLDIPVGENEMTFPHTIAKIGDGYAFVFIKKLGERWHFLVGQEDILPVPKSTNAKAHFKELLNAGLGEIMPFLTKAKVERMLSGVDVENKELMVQQIDSLYAANCGSAVRSCVWIGQELSKRLS